MQVFEYGNQEIEYLIKKDAKLGEIIEKIDMIHREIMHDTFSALIYSIVGQQISGKAADTVYNSWLAALDSL